jgi:hypothetical protein
MPFVSWPASLHILALGKPNWQADVATASKEVYGNKGYMVDGEMLQGS